MKNVNLIGLFLALVTNFGVTGFSLNSLIPEGKEPIDASIDFVSGNVGVFDLGKIDELLKENITGEVKQAVVSLKEGKIHIYIEFLGGDTSHWDK